MTPGAALALTTLDSIQHSDALALLRTLPTGSVDLLLTDPPYAEIERDYGRLTEAQWGDLMRGVATEARRVLKPSGSAVFILQPNFEKIGRMRMWLWRFMLWCGDNWNVVQDAYWWNHAAMPVGANQRDIGLLRASVKPIIWCGEPNCYRDQSAVLWSPSLSALAMDAEDRALVYRPSGLSKRTSRMAATVQERGGVTPFNLLPVANTNSATSAGAHGHGAGTPAPLLEWWIRYLAPKGGIVLDPFIGSGTTAVVARSLGRHYIGGDSNVGYIEVASKRLRERDPYQPYEVAPGLTQGSLFEIES